MSKKKGLRIGSFRITPLGIGVLAVILLIIIAAVVLFVNPFGISGEDSYYTQWTATATPTPSPTPTPTPTPTPAPTPTPTPRAATIRVLGEITADTDILTAAKSDEGYDFSKMFSYAGDLMSGADYTIGTVQGSMGGTVDPYGDKYYRTPAEMITALKDAGVDMLDLAVNHALDGNFDDLFAEITNCQNAGMDYIGAASSASEKKTARVVEVNGIKIGFVAYTASVNGLEKKVDKDKLKYGINYVSSKIKTNPKNDIKECVSAGAEVVVAFMGWGAEGDRNTNSTQQKLAQYLCDAGADIIIGYNPGVIQSAAWLESKGSDGTVTHKALCMSSMGSFLTGKRDQYRDSGVILQFSIEETPAGLSITSPVYIPTCVWRTGEEGAFEFYTLPVGQYIDSAPDQMNYTQFTRIKEIWAEAQSIMGINAVSIYSGTGEISTTAAELTDEEDDILGEDMDAAILGGDADDDVLADDMDSDVLAADMGDDSDILGGDDMEDSADAEPLDLDTLDDMGDDGDILGDDMPADDEDILA